MKRKPRYSLRRFWSSELAIRNGSSEREEAQGRKQICSHPIVISLLKVVDRKMMRVNEALLSHPLKQATYRILAMMKFKEFIRRKNQGKVQLKVQIPFFLYHE